MGETFQFSKDDVIFRILPKTHVSLTDVLLQATRVVLGEES